MSEKDSLKKLQEEYEKFLSNPLEVARILSEVRKLKGKVELLPKNNVNSMLLVKIIKFEREVNAQDIFLKSISGMRYI